MICVFFFAKNYLKTRENMDKKLFKRIFIVISQTFFITTITLFAVLPISCKVTSQGIQIIGGNYTLPQLDDVEVIDDKTVVLRFSEEVSIKNLIVSPFLEGISNSTEISQTEELSLALKSATDKNESLECVVEFENENKDAKIIMNENTKIGKKYEIYGVVEDKIGNSLTFCVPFRGFNSKIPKLLITEIHPAMASQTNNDKSKNIRRLEYVKILALTDGNLSGLKFCSGSYGEDKGYDFPAVEVKQGEFFLLHLRSWGEGCISEECDDLSLAFSRYTSETYRDLWTDSATKCVGDKRDILIIKNSITGELCDAFMYTDGKSETWSDCLKTNYSLYEDFSKIYENVGIENAFLSTGVGTTKVFARTDIEKILFKAKSNEDFEYPVKNSSALWRIFEPSF